MKCEFCEGAGSGVVIGGEPDEMRREECNECGGSGYVDAVSRKEQAPVIPLPSEDIEF